MKASVFSSTLIGTSIVAATLGTAANPVEAFVITNTAGSWDNALLSSGTVVGSNGESVAPRNDIIFQENNNDSQVRWGDSVNGHTETWAFNWDDYYAGHSYAHGWYTNTRGRWVEGYYNYEYVSNYEDKSGLGFKGVSNLSIAAGDIFNIGSLTHFNQTIWGNGKDAVSADFSLDLDFGDFGIGTQTFDFTFLIDETLNSAEVCEYQTDAGKGCADKITWDWSIDESSSFMFEGDKYTLELVGFSEQVAAASITNKFISQENGDNSAGLFARLVKIDTTQDIPEPASLLGLAGLGLFVSLGRKRHSNQASA